MQYRRNRHRNYRVISGNGASLSSGSCEIISTDSALSSGLSRRILYSSWNPLGATIRTSAISSSGLLKFSNLDVDLQPKMEEVGVIIRYMLQNIEVLR